MLKFLILEADYPCGRGSRGLSLYRFLATYHGHRAVRMLSTRELLSARPLQTEVLFIGMPSQLSKEHLRRVQHQQAVLFDYQDGAGPVWMNSDERLLRSLTDRYFKPWVETSWDNTLRYGTVPIRRRWQLTLCVQGRAMLRRFGGERWLRPIHDVAFVGNAAGNLISSAQRVKWMREIRDSGERYRFWGGIAVRPAAQALLEQQFHDFATLRYPEGRVGFAKYFAHLARAKVALAPSGNARWSYRHYEALYARAMVVTTDFRQIQTLVPLPCHNMVHVADGESVLPAIDRALALREAQPEIVDENVRFLETYLHHGDYSRRKPALWERFHSQLT